MIGRRILMLLTLISLTASGVVEAGEPRPNVPPEGFKALFNGKDLTGWKGLVGNPKTRAKMSKEQLAAEQKKADELAAEHWKVVDGVLVGRLTHAVVAKGGHRGGVEVDRTAQHVHRDLEERRTGNAREGGADRGLHVFGDAVGLEAGVGVLRDGPHERDMVHLL